MSAEKPRRRKRLAVGAGALAAAGGVLLALGPGAPWLVDHLLDGQRIWRLGRIEIDGVSGAWLGALRAERVALADGDGAWLEAGGVELNWRPQALLTGDVFIDAGSAETLLIMRRPTLSERRPPSPAKFDIHIGAVRVGALSLAQDAVGEAAVFSGAFSMTREANRLQALALELRRLDSDADRAHVAYENAAAFALAADIYGAPGGVFSRALGVADRPVTVTAAGSGAPDEGEAQYEARIGQARLAEGDAEWSEGRWRHDARADLRLLPALERTARRIGGSLQISAHGDDAGRLSLTAETPFLQATLEGAADEHDPQAFRGRLVATTQRLSDIARESPFELGPAQIEGEVRRANGAIAIQGDVRRAAATALGRRAIFAGPVSASLNDLRFTLDGDVRAIETSGALFAGARLQARMNYERATGRYTLERAELAGDALALDASGWTTHGAGEYAGEWRVRRLGELAPDLSGAAAGGWRAFTEGEERVWATTVAGRGEAVSGDGSLLGQMLGAQPQLDGRFRYENHGVTVSHVRIDGARLRAGGSGRIVAGVADIALEVSARGPLSVGGAQILGAADATGSLTGRIGRPAVSAVATLSSFQAGSVAVERPVLTFTLEPQASDYAGTASLSGSALGQPLLGSAQVSSGAGVLSLTDLDAQWGGLLAQGAASFASRGMSATLDVNGAFDGLIPGAVGRIAGALALTPDEVTLDARVADARMGELSVRTATVHASGPVREISARYALRGRLRGAPLSLAGTATADAADGFSMSADGRGALAGADLFTRAPIELQWRERAFDASFNVAVGDGAVVAAWREAGATLQAAARIEDAPLEPLAAIWGERAVGRIDGTVNLHTEGRGLGGALALTLDDARFAGRQRGALDMRVDATLSPSRLQAIVDATSADGLVAHFDGEAPVQTSAAPLRVALAPDRRGRGAWSVRGPAQSLWAATRLQDQSLSGLLDGEGEISFGAGYLSGAGNIEIAGGRFEDKLTGVTLVDLDARLALGGNGVTIERFTATGARGGRLSASGGSTSPTEGRIAVDVDDIRIANRPDARARADGELALEWSGRHSKLTGELAILEAELDVAASPTAGIPTLDVIEVNRPGAEEEELTPAPTRNGSTDLDIRIAAPGRVYTRGRGVNAEWALNLRLAGTARAPQLFGEARAVRGELALSGQPFEIEDAVIRFGGDPMDAEIDLAATRDTADMSARIRLTGTARDPEIAFSSDPPLPEDEILPQVLFGRSVQDLSAFEAAQLAAGLAALSGRASLDLLDAARAAAGLDRLNIRQDQQGGLLVAGGVYLTRDVYLEMARSELGETETRVEWTVRPRLVLITSFLGDSDQRVSLRWRRESD